MRIYGRSMEQTQQAWLHAAKEELQQAYGKLTWDQFAEKAGIAARAFKTYRMPESSGDYRTMDKFVRKAVEDLLKKAKKRAKNSA